MRACTTALKMLRAARARARFHDDNVLITLHQLLLDDDERELENPGRARETQRRRDVVAFERQT